MLYRLFLAPLLAAGLSLSHGYSAMAAPAEASPPEKDDAPWFVSSGDPQSHEDLLKSPSDERHYRYLTLDNGLEVVLISDPGTDKAAASLSIDVGSFQNPAEREGLAHFLEHMLFLGTDKYPEPGEYQTFLSEHGGSFNAYTSLEETNYFFDVDSDYLVPTLDRFSRFFVAPLFNPEYVDRERHAVDSEYQLKIRDDSRREWDVLRELANPEHPFSLFSVGSLETLDNSAERPVRDDLLAFYGKYYSASRMNLVVLGGQPLDELQAIVTERFSEVPANGVELEEHYIPLFKRALPFRVDIRPVKELRQLSFNFPVPRVSDHWREKPLDYLGHLLGHEGEGSLLARLKEKGLAEGLQAGLVYDSRYGALFSVQIDLTPAGVEKEAQVSRAFFAWLELIKSEGIEQWRYEEVARIGELNFRFAEEQPPMRYVQQLSGELHNVDPGDLLRSRYLYDRFDRDLIARYSDYLDPGNVVVELIAPGVETDTRSALYDAPYRVSDLSVNDLSPEDNEAAFSLPSPNPYLPDDLTVSRSGEAPEKPVRIESGPGMWYYPDHRFGTPKGYFQARIALPEMATIERAVLLDYLLAVVRDQLDSEAYIAMLAGLKFDLSSWEKGFTVTLSGYDDKQEVLLARIIEALERPDWRPDRLSRVKTSLIRQWRNTQEEWPLRQLFLRLPTLVGQQNLPLAMADVLESVDADQLKTFHRDLMSGGKGRYYAGGNYSRDYALKLADLVAGSFGANHGVEAVMAVKDLPRVDPLPVSPYYVEHSDSAALLYLQGDRDTLAERAVVMVLNNIIAAPFYNALRTEKQLGYAVGSSIFPVERVPGALYYVQSPKVGAEVLREEINEFLAGFREQIDALEDGDIERYQRSVLARIEEKPRNLNELAARHLESLNLGYEDFDFRNRLAGEVRALTREKIAAAYDRLVVGERAGLWLLTTGDEAAGNRAGLEEDYIEGIFEYPL